MLKLFKFFLCMLGDQYAEVVLQEDEQAEVEQAEVEQAELEP
jgi:hypothetical protein